MILWYGLFALVSSLTHTSMRRRVLEDLIACLRQPECPIRSLQLDDAVFLEDSEEGDTGGSPRKAKEDDEPDEGKEEDQDTREPAPTETLTPLAEVVAQLLEPACKLQSLSLRGNGFGPDGACFLNLFPPCGRLWRGDNRRAHALTSSRVRNTEMCYVPFLCKVVFLSFFPSGRGAWGGVGARYQCAGSVSGAQ